MRRLIPFSVLFATACGMPTETYDDLDARQQPFSSDQATLLDFTFRAELTANFVWSAEQLVEEQLLYTVGHLNADDAVGRLDRIEILNIDITTPFDPNKAQMPEGGVIDEGWRAIAEKEK